MMVCVSATEEGDCNNPMLMAKNNDEIDFTVLETPIEKPASVKICKDVTKVCCDESAFLAVQEKFKSKRKKFQGKKSFYLFFLSF